MSKTLLNEISIKKYFLFFLFLIANSFAFSQYKKELTAVDKSCLEAVILEKYHIADSLDYKDTIGGLLEKGSITYRIYIDLKAGYKLQAVFGVPNHELKIETTTHFYNNNNEGRITGDLIDNQSINENNVAFDSWLSMGAATKSHFGVLMAEDKNGSYISKKPLQFADGLLVGNVPRVTVFGLDLSFLKSQNNTNKFYSSNGSIAVLGGAQGPDTGNKILVAQLTTNGNLSFELNIQVGTPSGGVIQYVAKNPTGAEIKFDQLAYPSK